MSAPRTKVPGGSSSDSGARGSGPAMARRSRVTSSTVRANGPLTPSGFHASGAGTPGTRPGDGRSPTRLQNDAGLRMLAP